MNPWIYPGFWRPAAQSRLDVFSKPIVGHGRALVDKRECRWELSQAAGL